MDQKEFVELFHTKRLNKVWYSLSEVMRRFFRLEVEGIDYVPKAGSAIIAPNHSGYAGMDGIMLSHLLHMKKGRTPKMMAHRAFFEWFKLVRLLSESFGLKKACFQDGLSPLCNKELLILFPEAETGNFKSSLKRYKLQKFHSGFVRLALKGKVPIIPCLIIGAEDTYFNLGSIDLTWFIQGLRIPVPMNFIPLPAKWKIVFLEPITYESIAHVCPEDRVQVRKLVKKIQRDMQKALGLEVKKREYIYFPSHLKAGF